jgi:hypothetical protein
MAAHVEAISFQNTGANERSDDTELRPQSVSSPSGRWRAVGQLLGYVPLE